MCVICKKEKTVTGITAERINQDLRDLLVEYNLVDPVMYEYNELKSILIELTNGYILRSHEF